MLDNVANTTVIALYPNATIDGIKVVFADLQIDREDVLIRLRNAFDMLRAADARRYGQLQRYCRHIIAWGGHYSSANKQSEIRLGRPHLTNTSTMELASTLVHEVTHLRIAQHRIAVSPSTIARMEKRCIAEQVDFLRARGSSGATMADIIESALDDPWWTEDVDRADMARLAEDAGMPRWVAAGMRAVRRIMKVFGS